MAILDDTAIFVAVIQQGGFSRAAQYLNVSNGLISRRIRQLEMTLGVTLIKRTTRQFQLTPEGDLFWQHAQRIQQDLETAITLIQNITKKPKGLIRLSVPSYIGRRYLMPVIMKFLKIYQDIHIDLNLTNQTIDIVKDNMDLVIRGAGFINTESLKISNLKAKLLRTDNIKLYAKVAYLQKRGMPNKINDLSNHDIIVYTKNEYFLEQEKWQYQKGNKKQTVILSPKFRCNDIEGCLTACGSGYGIGRFSDLVAQDALQQQLFVPILQQYHWGQHHLYAIYPSQQNLAHRTRLLIDYIATEIQKW